MNSSESSALISRFLADDLDQAERDRLAEAIQADPALRAEVLSQQRLAVLIHAASVRRDDPRVVAGVLNALRVSRAFRVVRGVRGRQTRQRQRRTWIVWAAAAAVLVVTALGWHLLEGPAIRTAGATGEQLALEDGTRLFIAAQATYAWEPASRVLRLEDGRMSAQVVKQDPARPLRIVTSEGVATVLGTRFRLTRDAAGTRLDVDEGTVRLAGSARSVLVEAMQGTVIRRGASGPESVGLLAGVTPDKLPPEARLSAFGSWFVKSWDDRARVEIEHPGSGPLGIRSAADVRSWVGRILDPIQDWSGSQGLAIRLRVGGNLDLHWEVTDIGVTGNGTIDVEHWKTDIVVSADTWRRLEIPFSSLRIDRTERGNDDVFDPSRLYSMGIFIRGVGRVEIDTIELIP